MSPRDRLLEQLIAHASAHGLHDMSLRGLAAAVGSSHRMLRYHFGARAELLAEMSQAVEAVQRAAFDELLARPDLTAPEVMWAMYVRIADPTLAGAEQLFFELYARALRDEDPGGFLPGVVTAWLPSLRALFERVGFAGPEAEAEARLSLAVSRGLLLDLLGTGDRAAVDAAARRYFSRFEPAAEGGGMRRSARR